MQRPCDECSGNGIDLDGKPCSTCKGHGVMYEIMLINDPSGEEFLMMGWDKNEAVEAFGTPIQIKHLRAYPKDA